MKKVIFSLGLLAISSLAFAGDRYKITTDPYGGSPGGSTEIEMRQKYDYDPSSKYRGEIDSNGSVRMRNSDGDRLHGNINSDGSGRLRDQDGNTYRVRPR